MAFHQKSGAGRPAQVRPSAPARKVPVRRVEPWARAQWLAALPAAVASVGLSVSADQQGLLADYMVLLAHWNSTYNLTALRDPQDMLSHHLVDCLTVLQPLARHLAQRDAALAVGDHAVPSVLDVGSGGGLPGVVLAICMPGVKVTCVDTVGKKAAFIRQVAAELKLPNLKAEHARVEQLSGRYDVITSRAFASLVDFVTLTQNLLAEGVVWMAMKGRQPDDELAALPENVAVFHVEQLQVPGLGAQRCLIWMRSV
ncbi:MAG: 16S rRNA (guanine(527)-N(7))-methyltransferase RsmG [Aquabacterium sp.]|nr:16S rRNA (guanine(527)-N(7))-methyltransferase RsmG [Aquabacterium sp.]